MYPIFFLTFALIGSFISFTRSNDKSKEKMVEILLMYMVVVNIGFQGIFAAMGHLFMPNKIAQEIGWPTGSPFQFEVGMANLGFGISGLFGWFWRGKYWFGPIIANLVFIYGAAYGHIVQMQKGDMSPYNSGVFLYVGDIAIPTLYLILAILYYLWVLKSPGKK